MVQSRRTKIRLIKERYEHIGKATQENILFTSTDSHSLWKTLEVKGVRINILKERGSDAGCKKSPCFKGIGARAPTTVDV